MQLCHGNLSLESVILRRLKRRSNDAAMDTGDAADDDNDKGYYYCCTITEFGSALRIPFADDDDDDGSTYHLLEPQPLLGARSHHSQYIAPELWSGGNSRSSKSNDENSNSVVPFDGFAVDLWAAGVMLLAMLLGSDALFVAPVLEDRAFQQICVHGHLKEYVHYQAKRRAEAGRTPATTTPSALISDAALDLLQRMLRADPKDRLTLAQVQVHPWVVGVAPHAL